MNDIKIKINTKQALTLIKVSAIIFIIALFSYIGYFLYKNFYQTMIASEELIKSQKSLAGETLDMKKFNETLDMLEKKNKNREINPLNNPFD